MQIQQKNNKFKSKSISCSFCNGRHNSRSCVIESKMSSIFKESIGIIMEHYICNNILCPECNTKNLKVIGNNAPSLDIICNNCYNNFELKSKCLSVDKLPNDIKLNHGRYNDFMNRINDEKLNLMTIIYGVDRSTKGIYIREILYLNNYDLSFNDNVFIEYLPYNNKSIIHIKNRNYLRKIELIDNNDAFINFKFIKN